MNNFARFSLAGLSTVAGSAMAAVPADVTTALSDMKADGLVVASAVLVALISIAAIKYLRKAM